MSKPIMTRDEFNAKLLPFLRNNLTVEQHIEVVEMRENLLAAERERCAALCASDQAEGDTDLAAFLIRRLE